MVVYGNILTYMLPWAFLENDMSDFEHLQWRGLLENFKF